MPVNVLSMAAFPCNEFDIIPCFSGFYGLCENTEELFQYANLDVAGGLLTGWLSGSPRYGAWWSGLGPWDLVSLWSRRKGGWSGRDFYAGCRSEGWYSGSLNVWCAWSSVPVRCSVRLSACLSDARDGERRSRPSAHGGGGTEIGADDNNDAESGSGRGGVKVPVKGGGFAVASRWPGSA